MNLESRLRFSSKLLRKYIIFVSLGLLIFSGGSLAFVNHEGIVWANYLREAGINPRLINRPNIIFYSSDGLNANSLSAYGYERETTPNIDRFIKTHNVLFFENAFVNSAHTPSSLISMLNSKYPFTTRVIEAPEILRGKDSLEHLPAILKGLGYRSIFYGTRHYADPYDANMIGAFDIANDRKGPSSAVYNKLSSIVGQMTTYFVIQIYERVSERLLHIFGVRLMEDFYTAITKGGLFTSFHKDKNQKLFAFMDESDTPVFALIHFLETHGPKYRFPNEEAYFSKGRKQDKKYDIDFYDDSIRGFDAKFGSLINYLEEAGKSQNTIIIITSDHGFKWTELERVPLLMYFPNGQWSLQCKDQKECANLGYCTNNIGLPRTNNTRMDGRSISFKT